MILVMGICFQTHIHLAAIGVLSTPAFGTCMDIAVSSPFAMITELRRSLYKRIRLYAKHIFPPQAQ